ncbi:MAG: extracellular solute-binding protein [Ruminococcaceae bacterium]|nr:extracellular solute-binding protein [Oscillospiraceae bacterium]
MKKILAVLLLVAMCVASLTFIGCEDKHKTTTEAPTTEADINTKPVEYAVPENGYDGSEVTITFSHTMNAEYQKVLDKYIKEFNKLYPKITIEHAQVGGYDEVRDQIKTELTAGNQPNIAYCYPDHVALYNVAKAVVPLNSFIDSQIEVTDANGNKTILGLTEEQKADFITAFYEEGAVFDKAGTMYTLPMSKSTEVIYYNKDFFTKHNLTVPTTWEEMKALCKKIKEIDPNCIPLGYDSEANWFITMCEQYGSDYTSAEKGKYFLFNNDTNKAFVKEFRSWYEAGYLTTQELYGGYTSGLFTELSGKRSYMSIGSTGGAIHQRPAADDDGYAFDVGIAPIPQVNPEAGKAISQGPSLCIFDNPNKQEVVASWLFVEFLTTNKEFQAAFSMTSGYMPVIKSVDQVDAYKNFLAGANGGSNIQALAVKVAREMSDLYFVSPAFNGSSLARDKVGALMQYCFVQQTSNVDAMIDEAFKNAVKACYDGQ